MRIVSKSSWIDVRVKFLIQPLLQNLLDPCLSCHSPFILPSLPPRSPLSGGTKLPGSLQHPLKDWPTKMAGVDLPMLVQLGNLVCVPLHITFRIEKTDLSRISAKVVFKSRALAGAGRRLTRPQPFTAVFDLHVRAMDLRLSLDPWR